MAVSHTRLMANGQWKITGTVSGQPATTVKTVTLPEGYAPSLEECQAILDGAFTVPAAAPSEEDSARTAYAHLLASMTVAQVQEYAASLSDVGSLRTAIAAEEAGKGRSGALNALNARIDELTAPPPATEPDQEDTP